jgi:hypothetical protein
MGICVEFVYPLEKNGVDTFEESYMWPYKNLEVDLGIEEMEEIKIPYQARQSGIKIPPILLGMLDNSCPYNQKIEDENQAEMISIFPEQCAAPLQMEAELAMSMS